MSYLIKTHVFEGPYDLLIFLIKKGEVDIYDIPISKITKEYLDYIAVMHSLNLDIAGEFIVMAATLMRIKAKMLLPVYLEEEEEIEDPRRELVQNLLEYQRIKNASEQLETMEKERSYYYPRGSAEKEAVLRVEDDNFDMQMSVYELVVAFNEVIKGRKEEKIHYVIPEPFTIEEKMDEILRLLEAEQRIAFRRYLMNCRETYIIIVNFLALLELAKGRLVTVSQAKPFKEIWVRKYVQKGD